MALFPPPRVFIQSLAEEADDDGDLGSIGIHSQQGIGHAQALVFLGSIQPRGGWEGGTGFLGNFNARC